MKRKALAILLTSVMVLTMAGCAGSSSSASSAVTDAASAAEEAVSEAKSAVEEAAAEAESVVEEAESVVEEAAAEAESAVEEAAAEAESAVEEVAAEAESAAEEAAAEAESLAEEAVEEAQDGAEEGLSLGGTVMTYEEYLAADLDTPVLVETYVMAKQSWYEGAATVYTQSEDGAYFLYSMPCTEEEYEKLVPGTKIKVAGYKAEYAGEIEIIDSIFEIEDGSFTPEPADVTELLGTDELAVHMNQLVSFKGMTVEPSKAEDSDEEVPFLYSWNGSGQEGDDLYFNVSLNGKTYTFTVESYLNDASSDVYKAVQSLNIGDVIDMEGFLYWYEGPNPHITAVTAAEEAAE